MALVFGYSDTVGLGGSVLGLGLVAVGALVVVVHALAEFAADGVFTLLFELVVSLEEVILLAIILNQAG
jgi:hypothetical protein